MRKIRVIVAVQPRSLLRVIEHLLGGQPELRIVARLSGNNRLSLTASAMLPELIIANARFLGRECRKAIPEIKRASPGSKLILLLCPFEGFARETRDCGADAYLEEEAIVRRLLPALGKLLRRPELSLSEAKGRIRVLSRMEQ